MKESFSSFSIYYGLADKENILNIDNHFMKKVNKNIFTAIKLDFLY